MASVSEVFHDVKSAVIEFGSYSYNEVTNSEGIISTVKNIGVAGIGVLTLSFDKILNLVGIHINNVEDKQEVESEDNEDLIKETQEG